VCIRDEHISEFDKIFYFWYTMVQTYIKSGISVNCAVFFLPVFRQT